MQAEHKAAKLVAAWLAWFKTQSVEVLHRSPTRTAPCTFQALHFQCRVGLLYF